MKQKLFSWGGDFDIRDEQERVSYLVDGKVFTPTPKGVRLPHYAEEQRFAGV